MTRKVLVAGLGLIGGSLAKAMKKDKNNYIIGFDLSEETLTYAEEKKIIDEATSDFLSAVHNVDIIIIATPISATIQLLQQLNNVKLENNIIVSDVSSVKGSILEVAQELTNEQITFIGGHPMAGSHKAGIEAAKGHLFENALYVLTPTNDCPSTQLECLKETLAETKSNFIILQPEEHDEMTSVISHFPHLIASSLVHQARKWEQIHDFLPELAAGGFRDITRIASSNPKMWQDIFQHNGEQMSRLLQDWINEMVTLKEFLDKNSKEQMITYLQQAKNYRDGLGVERTRGALPSYYDLYVDVKDQPGAIAAVVQLLAEAEISLRNIRILEIRDNISGALRLSVTKHSDQEKAYDLLNQHDYDVYIDV